MDDLDKYQKRIAVTGGAGFIGTNLLMYMVPKYQQYLFVNIDCLTYAGNLLSLKSIENDPNYRFEKINICDYDSLENCFDKYQITDIIHLAAETHVDQSISNPAGFVATNICGTFNLLEIARIRSEKKRSFRFHNVSTDEVFGSLNDTGSFTEKSPYRPNSPYSATKAGADYLIRAYNKTYGLNSVVTNSSNSFGPYQFPEKLIPLVIKNAISKKPIPVYGDGSNIRDWLYVKDNCRAIDMVFHEGETGLTYNIGGRNEIKNIELIKKICRIIDKIQGDGPHEELIEFVKDRPGHDKRYAIDPGFIETELGWKAKYGFDNALEKTVLWYLNNLEWMESCISGHYLKYYEETYTNR
ncbi:MAG: dTDP-glucose 4,6-dehydratase [candidate division Zixibacteria bacterium]|nr:dTDP-glucose 4,6-dehydratase [candidate division Zixibacteria bacterium]